MSNPYRHREKFYSMRNRVALFKSKYFDKLPTDKLSQIEEYLRLFGKNKLTRLLTFWKTQYIFFKQQMGLLGRVYFTVRMLLF